MATPLGVEATFEAALKAQEDAKRIASNCLSVEVRSLFFPKAHRAWLRIMNKPVPEDTKKKLPDWFEWLSLFIILVNMVALALNDPTELEDSAWNERLLFLEFGLMVFFAVEVLLRFVAFGPRYFAREIWNWLDVIVVATGITDIALTAADMRFASLGALRALRVLRPLRSATKFPAVRIVVAAMFSSIRALLYVMVLFALFLLSFGAVGVTQYSGSLRSRCVNSDYWLYFENRAWYNGPLLETKKLDGTTLSDEYPYGITSPTLSQLERMTTLWRRHAEAALTTDDLLSNLTLGLGSRTPPEILFRSTTFTAAWNYTKIADFVCSGRYDTNALKNMTPVMGCDKTQTCDLTPNSLLVGYLCPFGYRCVSVENPMFGFLGFDNILQSVLTIQALVTLKVIPETAYALVDAVDFTAGIFVVAVVVVGTFFIINLLVAMIVVEFQRSRDALTHRYRVTARRRTTKTIIEKLRAAVQERKSNQERMLGVADDAPAGAESAPRGDIAQETKSTPQAQRLEPPSPTSNQLETPLLLGEVQQPIAVGPATPPGDDDVAFSRGTPRRPRTKSEVTFDIDPLGSSDDDEGFTSPQQTELMFEEVPPGEDGRAGDEEEAVAVPMRRRRSTSGTTRWLRKHGKLKEEAPEDLSGFNRFRFYLRTKVVQRPWFHHTTIFVNIVSVAVMGTEYYGMPQEMIEIYRWIDLGFAIFITIEMLIRFFATTPFLFFTHVSNSMGTMVVAGLWADFAITTFRFAIIRALRVVIAYRLVRRFPSIARWFRIIIKAFKESVVVMFIIALQLFIMACLGMQLFGGKFCGLQPQGGVGGWCEGRPRANFDAFGTAYLTSFRLLTGDDWNLVMYDAMRVLGPYISLLFIANHFIAVYVLVNLFVGIMLSATDSVLEDEARREEQKAKRMAQLRERGLLLLEQEKKLSCWQRFCCCCCGHSTNTGRNNDEESGNDSSGGTPLALGSPSDAGDVEMQSFAVHSPPTDAFADTTNTLSISSPTSPGPRERKIKSNPETGGSKQQVGCRSQLKRLLTHPAWDVFMVLVILVSTANLIITTPTEPPESPFVQHLMIIDWVTTGIFLLELFLQVVAHGLIIGKTSYLRRSWWNVFDAAIVMTSATDMCLTLTGVGTFGVAVVKGFYTLRPLRFMRRSAGIRFVLHSLVRAIPAIKDVVIVSLMLWSVFAILGVQLFKGEFYHCSDAQFTLEANCTATGNRWENADYHFDHFGVAMLSLFVLSTFEGWTVIMYNGIDAVGPGETGQLNYNPVAALFFVAFAVIGGFFLINLFISVLIGTYQKEKKKSKHRHLFLTPAQAAWRDSQDQLLTSLPVDTYVFPPQPQNRSFLEKIRYPILKVVTHKAFDMIVQIFVFFNFVAVAMDHYPPSSSFSAALNLSNMVFVGMMLVEILLKLFAMGVRLYFSQWWNRFDFAVLIVSVFGALADLFFDHRSFGAAFRLMRVLRLLRVIKGTKRVHLMVKKFMLSLYSLSNVAALVLLFFSITALICMRIFGHIEWDGTVINHSANFASFGRSLLMLFRIATGGGWPTVLAALRKEPPDCDPNIGGCGYPILAPVVFIVFLIGATYILLNVFVAVIMDNFDSGGNDDTTAELTDEESEQFVKLWLFFDQKRSLHVYSREVVLLLRMLPPTHPFAIKYFEDCDAEEENRVHDVLATWHKTSLTTGNLALATTSAVDPKRGMSEIRYFLELGLSDTYGQVSFLDLITALFRTNFAVEVNSKILKVIRQRYRRAFYRRIKEAQKEIINNTELRLASDSLDKKHVNLTEYVAAMVLLARFRNQKAGSGVEHQQPRRKLLGNVQCLNPLDSVHQKNAAGSPLARPASPVERSAVASPGRSRKASTKAVPAVALESEWLAAKVKEMEEAAAAEQRRKSGFGSIFAQVLDARRSSEKKADDEGNESTRKEEEEEEQQAQVQDPGNGEQQHTTDSSRYSPLGQHGETDEELAKKGSVLAMLRSRGTSEGSFSLLHANFGAGAETCDSSTALFSDPSDHSLLSVPPPQQHVPRLEDGEVDWEALGPVPASIRKRYGRRDLSTSNPGGEAETPLTKEPTQAQVGEEDESNVSVLSVLRSRSYSRAVAGAGEVSSPVRMRVKPIEEDDPLEPFRKPKPRPQTLLDRIRSPANKKAADDEEQQLLPGVGCPLSSPGFSDPGLLNVPAEEQCTPMPLLPLAPPPPPPPPSASAAVEPPMSSNAQLPAPTEETEDHGI